MKGNCRVRFAPSPTGFLHVGNARTALFNWLFARRNGGHFILRIEDTDQTRSTKDFERSLLEDLRWLGLEWDEGPEVGGPRGPYHQSERLGIYRPYLDRLLEEGKVYPCFCSEEELEAERIRLTALRLTPRYSGTCRQLCPEDRQRREEAGRLPAYRYKVDEGPIQFEDLIRGDMKFEGAALGDFIIMRSNGLPAYNFAAVVDDHLMSITHVIRGEDHLSNTAAQSLLYAALNFPQPLFAHHSLILGKDRTKLSKRHGSVSVREFRERGFLPEVLLNYLALLGNSFGEGCEVCDVSEIIKVFSLEQTGKSGAVFDEKKLTWLNSIYIKKYPLERLAVTLKPFMKKAGYSEAENVFFERLMPIIGLAQENMGTLDEIGDYLRPFDDNKNELSPEAKDFLARDDALDVVKSFRNILTSAAEFPERGFYRAAIEKVLTSTGKRGRSLFLPLRCAVTGSTQGPELDRIVEILGKHSVVKRLDKTIHAVA